MTGPRERKSFVGPIRAITFCLIFGFALFFASSVVAVTDLYNYYTGSVAPDNWAVSAVDVKAQTFCPTSTAYFPYSVNLKLGPGYAVPDEVYVSIKDIVHNGWAGSLCSSTFPGSMFDEINYYNLEIPSCPLLASTTISSFDFYSIVLQASGPQIRWYADDDAGCPSNVRGAFYYSSDGGDTFNSFGGCYAGYQFNFEIWGALTPYEPPVGGYNPVLTPAWPVDCIFNATDTFSGNATGRLEIPSLATGTWTKLTAIFYDQTSWGQNYYASTTFSLTAGQKLDYSMPYTLTTSTFGVWYRVEGQSCPNPSCEALISIDFCNTTLGISATPTAPEIISAPLPFEQESCSGYDLLERLVCEIKNFFAGVFLPNASSTLELQKNLDLVKQRMPYNYIVATRNFFASVNSTLTTSTPEISIMGATGTLDFGPLEATTTFAGSNQTISSMLRKFFQFFLILGFIAWAIGYLRKIFK